MKSLLNKNVLLGVSGGIAAYKSADVVRRLREAGATVRVVMTAAAKEFITPMTLQAVSGYPVHDDLFDLNAEAAMGHIALARWADLILIAPATADCLARLASGHANDLLTTLCLASKAPQVVAPAMNQQMWEAPATQSNCALLHARGVHVMGPGWGEQACGEIGPGRLLEPTELVEQVIALFPTGLLAGKTVLLTAGPTQEPLDPVRYVSNHSSGKMGYALAQAAVDAGAEVILISGPVALTAPAQVRLISVTTAETMLKAVMAEVSQCDIFIGVAAVSDYRPREKAVQKISQKTEIVTLELVRNPDILATVAALPDPPFTVGFAAQTDDLISKANEKLHQKKIDMIAANQVNGTDRGFHHDDNALTLLWANGQIELPLQPKKRLAHAVMAYIAERFHAKDPN